MKMKKSKHKKVKAIFFNKLVDFYVSHEETYGDCKEAFDLNENWPITYLAGWTDPVKPMSLVKKSKMLVPKDCVLFE